MPSRRSWRRRSRARAATEPECKAKDDDGDASCSCSGGGGSTSERRKRRKVNAHRSAVVGELISSAVERSDARHPRRKWYSWPSEQVHSGSEEGGAREMTAHHRDTNVPMMCTCSSPYSLSRAVVPRVCARPSSRLAFSASGGDCFCAKSTRRVGRFPASQKETKIHVTSAPARAERSHTTRTQHARTPRIRTCHT